jgi:hypothetical protein
MPRYRQVINEDGSSTFVEIGARRSSDSGVSIQGDIDPFVSPIDGTVISDRKQYREHCKQHNVVPAAEFSPEFYERKRKERERMYTGERTPSEIKASKMEIYERITQAERRGR